MLLALFTAIALIALGCRRSRTPEVPRQPTLRLYLASTLAGAIEPCGCRKDMLGGIDHAAALMKKGEAEAPMQLFVGAGPLLFLNPELGAASREQELWKAESLAAGLGRLKFAAWAPGANDFAAGQDELMRLAREAGALPLASNLDLGGPGVMLLKRGTLQIGLAGVSQPKYRGMAPKGVQVQPMVDSLERALSELERRGAALRIALVAAPRGEALRLAERVPGFHIFVVGKPADSGEGNDAPSPPVVVGKTLVVQGPNHLQGLGVVDLFVRGDSFDFADATGLERQEQRDSLQHRIAELTGRLGVWRADATLAKEDLAARETELVRLRQELGSLSSPVAPRQGSFFKYQLQEVREGAGEDPDVHERLASYYKRVNDFNREKFKDRKPKPAAPGQAVFVGAEACQECHAEAYGFWKKTGHAKAYETLSVDHKEFNLDCVSCHVTGYEQPGGSTVTYVDKLKDVQCEVCHGAGSLHAQSEGEGAITLRPEPSVCQKCHHTPHVADDWSVTEAWTHVVGVDHGADSKPPSPPTAH